jgi:hypothetical protein
MALVSKSSDIARTFLAAAALALALNFAGCASMREQQADDAEAAAQRSQESAARAEEAANKALESSAAAMKAADHAVAAVKEATEEMDRVSAHLEQLQKQRDADDDGDDAHEPEARPHHHKAAADKPANTASAAEASPAAKGSPAP